MAPPAQRERALISALVNPIAGPAARTTALISEMMSSPCICCHLVAFLKLERGFSLVAPWRQMVCHSETHGRHWTPLGMAGASVSN